MAASELTGKALFIDWNGVTISTDYHSFDETETADVVEATAGADANKTYIAMHKDGTASYTGLHLADGAGTAIWAALVPATEGTLLWAEEGSTAGESYHSVNAIVTSRNKNTPYDGVIEIGAEWQMSGAVTDSTIT